MNRRQFVKALVGTSAAVAFFPSLEILDTLSLEETSPWIGSAVGLQKGDVFGIEGVHALNPLTLLPTNHLQHFIILADVTADTPLTAPQIWPHLICDGPYRNADELPRSDARLITYDWNFAPTIHEWPVQATA